MSPRLAISAAISILMMAAFALFSTSPAEEPFGGGTGQETVAAQAGTLGSSLVPDLSIGALRR